MPGAARKTSLTKRICLLGLLCVVSQAHAQCEGARNVGIDSYAECRRIVADLERELEHFERSRDTVSSVSQERVGDSIGLREWLEQEWGEPFVRRYVRDRVGQGALTVAAMEYSSRMLSSLIPDAYACLSRSAHYFDLPHNTTEQVAGHLYAYCRSGFVDMCARAAVILAAEIDARERAFDSCGRRLFPLRVAFAAIDERRRALLYPWEAVAER